MTWHRGSIVCCDHLVAAFGDTVAATAIRRAGQTPLAGGDINQAFRIDCGAERFIVKRQRRRAGSDAYREQFPIDRGYSERRDLYDLYQLLNHANLFGQDYAAEVQQVIERLLAQLHCKVG
jgi:fructosamine-3-kinase